jgi:hypothetical protein
MPKKEYLPWMIAASFVVGFAMVAPVFAQGMPNGRGGGMARGDIGNGPAPAVVGSVTAINGTMLTLQTWRRPGSANAAGTIYTVDAANAEVFDKGATSTVAGIAPGDMVSVQGTANGTNITATVIRYGMNGAFGRRGAANGSTTPPFRGNGEPIVGGSVTAISGTTLTITNVSNVTYAVNAASSTVVLHGTTSTLASIAVGDNVMVQGVVNGTSITASMILDQGNMNHASVTPNVNRPHGHGGFDPFGFFGAIGGFFKHLFGF